MAASAILGVRATYLSICAVAGTPVAGSFVFLGLPFLLVTGRGQVRRGDRGARGARGASSAAVSYPLGAVSAAGVAVLSAVSAGEVLARLSARFLRISSRMYCLAPRLCLAGARLLRCSVGITSG
jgi:hypothetical protein